MLTSGRVDHSGAGLDDVGRCLPEVLRRAMGPGWEFTIADGHLDVRHRDRGTPYRPPRHQPAWADLLHRLKTGFARQGIPQAPCLPLRWGRETELTISAVQALDPVLKHGRPHPYRSGYLPQPAVRFTGRRDADGDLREGFLTSFVNVSHVQPIADLAEFGSIFDGWLSVLSCLGFHARHVSLHGSLSTWQRREVRGVTLRFRHADLPLGDIVLLWNAENPQRMAVDLGTALERLAWARSRLNWYDLVYGRFAHTAPVPTLDAIRTATLLLGHGISPAARGAGGIARRVIATIDVDSARLGVSAAVRSFYDYWALCGSLSVPWTAVVTRVERELGI
jgi:hypothetical protein